jgi:hypothetical protein
MAGLRFFKLSGYGKLACVSLLIILSIVVHNQLKSNSLLKDKLEVRIAKNSTSKQCMALLQQARMLDVGFEVFNKIQKASDLAARCDIRKAYCTYAAACFICNPFGVGFGIGNFPNAMGFCPYLLLSGGIWLTLPVLLSIIFSYFSQKPNYMAMRFTG